MAAKAYPPEVVAQALDLYREHGSSSKAAGALAQILGPEAAPSAESLRKWAQADATVYQQLTEERKQHLANRWYSIGNALMDRVETGLDSFTPQQSVVPAAIATDKFHKLVTEERQNAPAGNQTFIIFEQPRPEPTTIDVQVTDVTDSV